MAKPSNPRELNARRRRVVARANPLAKLIEQWLQAYALMVVKQDLSAGVLKAKSDDEMRAELEALLRQFGIRQATRSARSVGFEGQLPVLVAREIEAKESLVQGIAEETRDAVRRGIGDLIAGFRSEIPQPSLGEQARRIRRAFSGEDKEALSFAVSPARAALIARTENVQTENMGIFAGYQALGIRKMKWLAYPTGSGDRHHERMNDHPPVEVGDYFTTPLGNKLRFPGDPQAPIEDTAN